MNSYRQICDLLYAPIPNLSASDLQQRIELEVIKAINQQRPQQPLHLDTLCSRAADIVARVGLEAAVREAGVVGSDFQECTAEKTLQSGDFASNEEIIRAYFSALERGLDANAIRMLKNAFSTHCGIALKQTKNALKIHFIVFNKAICVNHAQFTHSKGVQIRGKLLHSNIRLCAVSIQDKEGATGKETIAGMSKIHVNEQEFEVKMPRITINSRSNKEKEVRFYAILGQNGAFGELDAAEIPQGAVLVHRMVFKGLWESNVMFEGRNKQDSEAILGIFERETAHNASEKAAKDREKGTKHATEGHKSPSAAHMGSHSRSMLPCISEIEPGLGIRGEISARDKFPVRHEERREEIAQFCPPPAPTAVHRPSYPSVPSVFQFPPFPEPVQPLLYVENPAQMSQMRPPAQAYYPTPLPSVQFPVEFVFPSAFPYNPSYTPANFSMPQASNIPFSSISAQGPAVKSPSSKQEYCQTSIPPSPTADSDEESVAIPCLLLPLPIKLFQQVSNCRPEKEENREMWVNRNYWDVVLKVKDAEIKAHRSVLAVSPFFKEQMQKSKSTQAFSLSHLKVIMPNWVQERPLLLVLMHLYQCDIDNQGLDLPFAKEILILADFLGLTDLVVLLIIKHIVLKLTKEAVLSIAQFALLRGNDGTQEAWDFLVDYTCQYAGQHFPWLLSNRRGELRALHLPLLIKSATAALQYHYNSSVISQLVAVLIEAGMADNALSLCGKISLFGLIAFQEETVDPRLVDFLRPYELLDFDKLPEDQIMEFESIIETDPWFSSLQRQSPLPPPPLDTDITQYSVPIPSLDSSHPFASKPTAKSLPLIAKETMELAGLKPVLTITIDDLARERSIVSPTFKTKNGTWFLTVVLHSSNISVFLCERNSSKDAIYTTVMWEIGLETKTYAQTSVFLYSFPNGHYQCVGERQMWRNGDLEGLSKVGISVRMRELLLHSAVLQYINERFETYNCSKYRYFKPLSCYDFYSLLTHNKLPIASEKSAISALWKYSTSKDFRQIDFLLPAIRWPFLSISDLCTLARDHLVIRQSPHFHYIFTTEMHKRLEKQAGIEVEPREAFGRKGKAVNDGNQREELVNWLLTTEHHEGFSRKIDENRKKYEAERSLFEGKSIELAARKQELYLENEHLLAQIKCTYNKVSVPSPPEANCVVM